MKQIILPILGAAAFIVLVGLFTQRAQTGEFSFPINNIVENTQKSEIKINDLTIPVKVAKTDIQRRDGLSNQDSLPEGEGMFFEFAQKDIKPPFWMKNMKFAIDILWIDDNKIVQIDSEIQPPISGATDNELVLYLPNQPIDYVLELTAGFSEEHNIKVGDTIELSTLH